MPATPVIAIFDVGKTNKKLFLLDEHYKIVWERAQAFAETTDEEGEACEDLQKLKDWIFSCVADLSGLPGFDIRAINFSAYGASFVHIGEEGTPVAPLYNYLKPFPPALKKKFYDTYGGEVTLSMLTASPVLGSLNSGMQLYRIKEQQPDLFAEIKYSLHLPQYLSFLYTGVAASEITSIGCHTHLWNFSQQHYHEWVYREGIIDKLAPLLPSTIVHPLQQPVGTRFSRTPVAGIGLHDSSAAMIPYLESFREPFVLISTGTWCISMNPFNESPLTVAELQKDCLCYLSYQGRPVKASRLFAGYEHEQEVKRLAVHFHTGPAVAATIAFDPAIVSLLRSQEEAGAPLPNERTTLPIGRTPSPVSASIFDQRDLAVFDNFEQAYHRLLMDIMDQQIASTQLVLQGTAVNRIFVDGGFGKNQVYMHLLAAAFPDMEVFAASMPQATAIGAAMAIHPHWNSRSLPGDIIELKYYK
jgi:sugar (pentulose or hexulose) kinase